MAGQTVTVKKGDTPYSIAKRYGVSVSALMFINNIKDTGNIKPGQVLKIPVINFVSQKGVTAGLDSVHFSRKPAAKAVQTSVQNNPKTLKTPTITAKPSTKPNPFASKTSVTASEKPADKIQSDTTSQKVISEYDIKKGDNFEKIEKAFWLKPGQIKKANPGISSNNLKIGQKINIPEKEYYIKSVDEKDKNFNDLINKVLKSEGGIASVKGKDGKTYYVNRGITKNAYDRYLKDKAFDNKTSPTFKDTRNITEKEIKELYYNYYYLASGANNIKDKKMAYWTLDTAVQCGISEAQRLSKICKTDTDWYNERLKIYNSYIANDSSMKKYLNGWKNRIDKIKNVSIS